MCYQVSNSNYSLAPQCIALSLDGIVVNARVRNAVMRDMQSPIDGAHHWEGMVEDACMVNFIM